MVEGLARLVTRDRAGMNILDSSYDYYVTGYLALAAVLSIDVERLWRALWLRPAGLVRSAFVDVVDRLRQESSGQSMSARQRADLRAVADQVFAAGRSGAVRTDISVLSRIWRVVLQ